MEIRKQFGMPIRRAKSWI